LRVTPPTKKAALADGPCFTLQPELEIEGEVNRNTPLEGRVATRRFRSSKIYAKLDGTAAGDTE